MTASGRAELIRQVVVDGESPRPVAAAPHISTSTSYKWLRRVAAAEWAGLLDRLSRPRSSPFRRNLRSSSAVVACGRGA
ncbi:MAG: helix-turn-helix domain-containing protein [Gemmatimonadales bacterium]|nr:helix-turn-helix domain-containing protein [Gemmatimonadota bacterium]MCL4214164.1 helix-turn-helix domain-containing protein [Gemmatimonadales bacterium]